MDGREHPREPATGGDELLDPRRLLVFAQVARHGSLAGAAAALGWTQPAVAAHVKRLERDTGAALVVRTSRGVLLTDAGSTLAAHADALTSRLRTAREELAALAELRTGRVRLAAFPNACATFVPAAVARLYALGPELDVRLTEAEPPQARDLLAAGDVDLAVVFRYDEEPPGPPKVVEPLLDDPLRLVLPADHRLAGRPAVDLAEVAEERWIAGCPRCRAHLVSSAAAHGFTPDIRHSTDDYVVTQTLVASGLGVALLPSLALAAARDPKVTAVALRGHPARHVELELPTELPLSRAGRALTDELRAAAEQARAEAGGGRTARRGPAVSADRAGSEEPPWRSPPTSTLRS